MFGSGRGAALRNYPGIVATVWWILFGSISMYWSLGGRWLLNTAVRGEGLALAAERPLWIVLLVFCTGVVKLCFALFGYLMNRPGLLPVPHWLYVSFGLTSGIIMVVYGLYSSVPGIPLILKGDMNTYRWMRMLVWMPQFWVGGGLIILATLIYMHRFSGGRSSAR